MGQARDEAGNIWETDAQGNAVRLLQAANQPAVVAPNAARLAQQQAEASRQNEAANRDEIRTGIAARGEQRDIQYKQYDNTLKLRSDFDALPQVKEYRTAITQLAQGLKTDDTPQGDLALIYAYAKVMDPGSVVREGEAASVSNADTIAGRTVAALSKQLSGSGTFSPEARQNLREEMLRKVQELNQGYNQQRQRFTADAQAFGIDPLRVVGVHDGQGFLPGIETGLRESRGVPDNQPPMWQGGAQAPGNPYAQDSGQGIRAATGQTKQTYDNATAQALDAMFRAGASAAELDAFAKSRNPGYSVPADQVANMRAYLQSKAGRNYKGTLFNAPLQESDTTIRERISASRPAAAAVGFANGVGFGGVDALAPDQMALMRNTYPGSEMVGEVGGAIAGTKGLGIGARSLASRLAPRLLGGGELAQAGRNLAVDTAYSGIYGANQGQDPLTSAMLGAGGSVLGQGAGKVVGSALGGATRTPAAELLAQRGVPMTVGQNLGGIAKNIEDRAMSLPIVGDIVANRRREAFDAFNRAAMNEAGAPVGATVNNVGEEGLRQLIGDPNVPGYNGAIGDAYDRAVAGVNVPLDPQFAADMAAARGVNLPPDLAPRLATALDNRVGPIENAGNMTGEFYQQAMRGLKGYKNSAMGAAPGFEQDWRAAIGNAQGALKGQMLRGGGDKTVQGIAKADEAYRNAKVIQKAIAAAKNGTATGDIQVFSPAQLNTAAYQAAAKFPGPRPFADLADAGQQVLPSKIPDSGTASRLTQIALPSLAVGGAAYGGTEGNTTAGTAALGILAALGATKGGQRVLNQVMLNRPAWLQSTGWAIGQRKGLFGAATIPFLLEAGQ